MSADFEPNDTLETAIGPSILSVVLNGGSVNDLLSGSVALLAGTTAADPKDIYSYSISPTLIAVRVAPSLTSFSSNALDEAGVHGVAHFLTITGIEGFSGNTLTIKKETGSYVLAYTEEYYALLTEINDLEIQLRAEYQGKLDQGIQDVALLADANRLDALEDYVFSLMEPRAVNADYRYLAGLLEHELNIYTQGSGAVDDIRALTQRALDLVRTWSTPVYGIGDASEPNGWREASLLEIIEPRFWSVSGGSNLAALDIWGYQALGVDIAYSEPSFRPTNYALSVHVAIEGALELAPPEGAVVEQGGTGPDTFLGGPGDDYLNGGAGDDTLEGGPGNDLLEGGDGFDRASYRNAPGGVSVDLRVSGVDVGSGQGADSFVDIEDLEGSEFEDILIGDNGDNVIFGRGARDVIYGQEGFDLLIGGWGKDSLRGGADDDQLWGEEGHDFLIGNRGYDLLIGGTGNDFLDGGSGFDTASYRDAESGVHVDLRYSGRDVGGGRGADTFESIEGLAGSKFNDFLVGTASDNLLEGDEGNDVLKGKGGNDELHGGGGDDKLRTEDGNDSLSGDAGSDILLALGGDDFLFGWEGRDFLYGGRGADILNGGLDDDVLRGNRDNDQLRGNEGDDDLRGGGGDDILNGGADNDYLLGGGGADTVIGGAGNDVLTGGFGASVNDGVQDVFVFASTTAGGGGFDRVKDFEDGIDRIDLTAFGITNFSVEVLALAQDTSGGLRIDFSAQDTLFIEGLTKADFGTADVFL